MVSIQSSTKTPLFCLNHQEAGMFDVKNKKCQTETCGTRPTFGLEWKTAFILFESSRSRYVNKRYQNEGCKKRAVFGFQWESICFAQVINKRG